MRRLACTALVGAWLAVPGAAAGSPSPAPPAPPPQQPPQPPQPPQPLDVAALAARSKTLAIDEDRLRAALVRGSPADATFSAVLDLGGGAAAVAWSECTRAACRGSIAKLAGGAERPKLVKRAALPAPPRVFFEDGITLGAPALADLDGDGASEIVLRYSVLEPPRRAVGSMGHDYVAVYAPGDLALLFAFEVGRAGAGSEDACEWTLATSGDRLIATGQCNELDCLAGTLPADECRPARKRLETWRKPPGARPYARVAAPPPPARAPGP